MLRSIERRRTVRSERPVASGYRQQCCARFFWGGTIQYWYRVYLPNCRLFSNTAGPSAAMQSLCSVGRSERPVVQETGHDCQGIATTPHIPSKIPTSHCSPSRPINGPCNPLHPTCCIPGILLRNTTIIPRALACAPFRSLPFPVFSCLSVCLSVRPLSAARSCSLLDPRERIQIQVCVWVGGGASGAKSICTFGSHFNFFRGGAGCFQPAGVGQRGLHGER